MAYSLADRAWPSALALPPREKRDYAGVANHSSNELDHPHLARLLAIWRERMSAKNVARYPSVERERADLAARLSVSPERVAMSAGSDAAILHVILAFCGQSGTIILDSPNYPAYERYATALGVKVTRVPYDRQVGRTVDALVSACASATVARGTVVLTNPHPLTGEVLSIEAVWRLASACEKHGHLLVVDETYGAVADVGHEPMSRQFRNVLVVRSFSKSLGMAGLRAAVAIGDEASIRYLRVFGVENSVSSAALEYVKTCFDNESLVDSMLRDVRALRDEVAALFRQARPEWWIPASLANFVLVDPHDSVVRDRMLARLREEKIVVRSLANEQGFRSAARLAVGSAESTRLAVKTILASSEAS